MEHSEMVFGIAFGAVIGTLLGDTTAGTAAGIAIGAGIGVGIRDRYWRRNTRPGFQELETTILEVLHSRFRA